MPPPELVAERVTNGMGGMPSFADTLSEEQIQDVAAYVSSAAGS
jgi:mono/diheme cytochrome c family protein